ncbi:MAG TPA: permease [Prolixibacteraceae bacterium]|nr:permease [Prolixibacteraceae bacterium]
MRNKSIIYIPILPMWIFLYVYKEASTNFIVYNWLSMPYESNLSNTIWFFISTLQKIFLLLVLVVFLAGILRSWFSPEKTRKFLEGKSLFAGNVMAALLGIVTPFCSCSAIPLFLGFIETGIPLGITFSFLIAAPMINEVAVIMLFSLFGWEVGMIYILLGLLIAIVSGWIIGRLKLEKWLQDWVQNLKFEVVSNDNKPLTFDDRIQAGKLAVKEIFVKIWPYVILGIAIGALVHGYVPNDSLASLINKSTWYSVPLAVLFGVPLYACSPGAVPIAYALIEKGVPLGTALAFMMSVIAISLPELIILNKVLKLQFILTFVGIIGIGIIIVGYLLNILL